MGNFFAKDKDGLTQSFRIAGDTPTASEQQQISSILNGKSLSSAPPLPVPEERGIMSLAASGIGAGLNQMHAGVAGLMADASRRNGTGTALGYSTKNWEDEQAAQNAEALTYDIGPAFFEAEGFSGKMGALAAQAGQSAPATVGAITGGIGGAMAGTAVGGPFGTLIGAGLGAVAGGAASLPQIYNENVQEQIKEHGYLKDPDKAMQGSLASAALEGIADRVLLGSSGALRAVIPGQVKDIVKEATKGAYATAAKTLGKSAGVGFTTEAVTEATQQAITRWQAEKPLGDQQAQKEYLESAIVGGLLGGTMGGAMGVVGARADFNETRKYEEIQRDLDAEDKFRKMDIEEVKGNITKNRELRTAEATAAAEAEAASREALLQRAPMPYTGTEDIIGLTGPKTFPLTQPVAETVPDTPNFSPEEYTSAVQKMRSKGMFSPDKIKNEMKIGRKKANALYEAMKSSGDAKPDGTDGKYLKVVDKVTRSFKVKELTDADTKPYRVVRQGGKQIGPEFKTPEDAHEYAQKVKLPEYAVTEAPQIKRHGVFEITEGLAGVRPSERLAKEFDTNEAAMAYAGQLDPSYSAQTNETVPGTKVKPNGQMIAEKEQQIFGGFKQNIDNVVRRILGDSATPVELVESITAPTGEGIDTGNVIEGVVDLKNGLRRMQLAYGVLDPNMSPDQRANAIEQVAHHEALHVAKEAGLFTDKEYNSLRDRASNTRVNGKSYTYLERAQVRTRGAPAGASLEEEAIAEMMRDYARDPSKFDPQTRTLLQRFFDFVKSFGQYSKMVNEGNQIVKDFSEGKFSTRKGRATREEMYGPYYSSVKIPGFYLKSAKYFEKIAQTNPELAYPGSQWVGMINPQKSQIKQEELDWLGLPDWLHGQKKVPVREILQYIAANSVDIQEDTFNQSTGTFHRETTQRGGDDYTEMLFHMPHLQPKFAVGAHYDGFANILASGRFKTRHLDGKKTLFIEEMQSDLHQQGKQRGYTSKADMALVDDLEQQRREIHAQMDQLHQQVTRRNKAEGRTRYDDYNTEELGQYDLLADKLTEIVETQDALIKKMDIPNAPLKTGWSDFVIKRLVRYAADNGFDSITWNAEPEGVALTEGYNDPIARNSDFSRKMEEVVNPDGTVSQKVTIRDAYDNSVVDDKDVTGIVNFYTKRLAKDVQKLFKSYNLSPYVISREDAGATAIDDLKRHLADGEDFQIAVGQLENSNPDIMKKYKRALQMASNQREFNLDRILSKVGIDPDQMLIDLYEQFPGLQYEETSENDFDLAAKPGQYDANGNPNVARWALDITPELKASAQGEGFPMFSSVQMREAPDTVEFKEWFAGSKVVGDDGKPLPVFHGSLKDFDTFRVGVPRAAVGSGIYATDTPDDASYNYAAPDGPDQIARMQDATDEYLQDNDEASYDDVDDEGVHPDIREQFMGHEGAVYPVWMSIQKPIVLDGIRSTQFTPEEIKLMQQAAFDIDPEFLNVFPGDIAEELQDVTDADTMKYRLERNKGVMDAIDPDTGMEAEQEVIRSLWEAAGFDGVIMKDVKKRWPMFEHIEDGTTHYIAFRPEQVKSINNSGSFSPGDKRMMFSSVQLKPTYSATGVFGGRVPAQAPSGTLADIEARITYNNIAPLFEKLLGKTLGIAGLSQKSANSFAEGTIIALQDKMQPLAKLIDRVRKNNGFISNESDTYLREQLMHGVVDTTIENNKKKFYTPIIDAVHNLTVTKTDADELLARHPSNIRTINGIPHETSAVRNILGNYENTKLGMAEVYLYAQHAKERNAEMRKRNEPLVAIRTEQYDSGSGMSDAEADDVLAWFGTKPFAGQFMDLSNPTSIRSLYRKLIANTNDVRVAGGLNPDFRTMIDPATNLPYDVYKDYAPLRGYTDDNPDHIDDDLTQAFARAGKGMKIMGKEDMSATGRHDQAANLIGNATLQNMEAVIRAEKNRVGQSFLKMINDNMGITLPTGQGQLPNTMADFAEVVPLTKQKPVYDRKSGVVRMQTTSVKQDPDIMVVKVGGSETGIKIKDARLRASFLEGSTLGTTGQSGLIKGLLKLNRVLAAVRTSYNPEFLLGNFFRDLEGAALNLSEQQMKGLRSEVAKSTFPAIRGVYNGLRDANPNNPWRKTFEEFSARGGKTAFMGIRDLDSTIENITKELSSDPGNSLEKAMDKAKAVMNWIEAWNDAVENGVRVSTYKHLVDRYTAMSRNPNDPAEQERIKNRAAFAAKNLTVNFNMGGTAKPTLQAWYLFFNASMQGSAALINPLIRSGKVRRLWMTAVAAGALQDVLMSTFSGIGDDGQKEYDKIPEQVLQTNMIMYNPFSDSGYIKIPMPYLFNAAWNSGRAMMRTARGGYTMGEGVNSIMGTLAEAANPWGGGGHWLNYVMPTVADPFIELATNTNFMGAPITPPDNPFGVGDIPSQRYWNNTSPLYVGVADWIDTLSGGDLVFPGSASFSPNQYEYMFEWMGGGALSTVVRAFDFLVPEAVGGAGRAAKLVLGEEVSTNDVPFLRRFVGNITSRENLEGYISKRDRVMTVKGALKDAAKDGNSEAYQSIMQDYPEEYRLASRINAVESRRKKLSGAIKKINDNKRLSANEKKKLVEPLKKQQETLVNQANALMINL